MVRWNEEVVFSSIFVLLDANAAMHFHEMVVDDFDGIVGCCEDLRADLAEVSFADWTLHVIAAFILLVASFAVRTVLGHDACSKRFLKK